MEYDVVKSVKKRELEVEIYCVEFLEDCLVTRDQIDKLNSEFGFKSDLLIEVLKVGSLLESDDLLEDWFKDLNVIFLEIIQLVTPLDSKNKSILLKCLELSPGLTSLIDSVVHLHIPLNEFDDLEVLHSV